MFLVAQSYVLNSPFKPDARLVRTVVASVFNRDITAEDKLSEAEAIAVLGTKLLLDMGYVSEEIQSIFRHYRKIIEEWGQRYREAAASLWRCQEHGKPLMKKPEPILLTIIDNKTATLIGTSGKLGTYFNFKDATEPASLVVGPILQIGLSLSRLFELVANNSEDRWYCLAAAEAFGAVLQAGQAAR
jgi:hypothetical protein